jgi:hypothetical protein
MRIENIPATVTVQEMTGVSGSVTYTSITDRVRLFSADQATTQGSPQTTNPVVIPSGTGYNYSYWKAICLDISGSVGTINNVRHYSDGTLNTWTYGNSGRVTRGNRDTGDIGCPDGDYAEASGTAGTTGYAIEDASNGHWYYKGQTTPVSVLNSDLSGSPPVVDSSSHTSTGKTKHIVIQVRVDSTATQGVQAEKTLTWMYDES